MSATLLDSVVHIVASDEEEADLKTLQHQDNLLTLLVLVITPYYLRTLYDYTLERFNALLQWISEHGYGIRCGESRRGHIGLGMVEVLQSRIPWREARTMTGMDKDTAFVAGFARLLLWHHLQPIAYGLAFVASWNDVSPLQRMLGVVVALREAIYIALTLFCLHFNPAYLLVDTAATWRKDRYVALIFTLLYVLSPEKYVWLALVRGAAETGDASAAADPPYGRLPPEADEGDAAPAAPAPFVFGGGGASSGGASSGAAASATPFSVGSAAPPAAIFTFGAQAADASAPTFGAAGPAAAPMFGAAGAAAAPTFGAGAATAPTFGAAGAAAGGVFNFGAAPVPAPGAAAPAFTFGSGGAFGSDVAQRSAGSAAIEVSSSERPAALSGPAALAGRAGRDDVESRQVELEAEVELELEAKRLRDEQEAEVERIAGTLHAAQSLGPRGAAILLFGGFLVLLDMVALIAMAVALDAAHRAPAPLLVGYSVTAVGGLFVLVCAVGYAIVMQIDKRGVPLPGPLAVLYRQVRLVLLLAGVLSAEAAAAAAAPAVAAAAIERPAQEALDAFWEKVGSSEEEVWSSTSLDWSIKGLDAGDARIVAYLLASQVAHAAAATGQLDALRFLSEERGPEVLTAAKADGGTPAHAAALGGHVDALRFLAERCGPEVLTAAKADGGTLAHAAALGGHVDALHFLAERCGPEVLTAAKADGGTPADAAALTGHVDTLRFLAERCGSEALSGNRAALVSAPLVSAPLVLQARVARHNQEDLLQIVRGAVAVAEVATKHCAGGAVDSAPARILSELRSLERTLQNERFELMVYGVYSVGKSRLLQTGYPSLNNMLPVSSKECTAHLIKIDVGGGSKGAKLHFHWSAVAELDSTLRDLLPEKVREFLDEETLALAREYVLAGCSLWPDGSEQESPPTLRLSEEEVSAWARVHGNDGASIKALASVVDHIAVGVTANADCQPYNIIDAPGLGADESRRAIAERHLRKCDVPIVVASFTDLSLEPLQEALRQIKASGHQPIIVITKLDAEYKALDEDDHSDQSLQTLMEASKADARRIFVQAGFQASDIHFVSAEWFDLSRDPRVARVRHALDTAGLPSDEDESTARESLRRLSGIPAFWDAVDELVMRGAARPRAGRVCEELAQHLYQLHCMLLDSA